MVNPETGTLFQDRLEDERQFDTTDIKRSITAPDSNRRIVQEIARYALQHEEDTGRFPKTLIFAANDLSHTSHADQLVQLCRETFNRGDGTRSDLGPEGRFRRFHISDIKARDYKLGITWLKDDSLDDPDTLPEPQDLSAEAITALEAAVIELQEIMALLEANGGNGDG